MIIFTIIGLSICVMLGTLSAGAIVACLMTLSSYCKDEFYTYVFFGSWIVSTAFLILFLAGVLL